jgi:hypothetical protein
MVDSIIKTTLLVIVIICINWIAHKQDWDGLVIVAVWIAPDPVNHDFVLFLDGFSYLTGPFMVGVSWL